MIQREKLKLNYIKREPQSGSFQGMRFTIQARDKELLVFVYPEPYCLKKTPKEHIEEAVFELSEAGLDTAAAWLNEQYTQRESHWSRAYETRMEV